MEAPRSLTSPVRTGNLVLKTRIALMIRNLRNLQSALATVKERRADLRQVLMFPERAEASIGKLGRALEHLSDARDDRSWDWDDIDTLLRRVKADLGKLDEEVSALKGPVSELRKAVMFDEEEVARTDLVATAIHESLKNAASEMFGDDLANLKALRGKIEAADRKGAANAEEMRAAWTQYSGEHYNSSERLFQEYVDLVSGVALRDTGFDRGIARLAEELLEPGRKIGTFTSNALTIPAREEALAVTAARIVRLGFPEWTIWTLPLTAYELACDYADSDKRVAKIINKLGGDPGELFVLVADAFATYFLGPAYACAAILMRLNPAEAFSGNRLVAKRAAIIFSALAQMDQMAGGVENHYAEITGRLAVEWEDALRQTGWNGVVDGGETTDAGDTGTRPELRRLTGLTVGEQKAIDELLHQFVSLVQVWLRPDVEAWPKVEEWADKLRRYRELLASDLGDLAQLRRVLNAAWRARIAVRLDENDIDDPDDLTDISEAVEDLLWTLVKEPKVPTTAVGAGPQRPPLQGYKSERRAQPGRESA